MRCAPPSRRCGAHVFNNVIWPDFASIPSREAPFVSFHDIGDRPGHCSWAAARPRHIEVLPAVHTVPACGFAVRCAPGQAALGVQRRHRAQRALLGPRERARRGHAASSRPPSATANKRWPQRSLHLSPASLADELAQHRPAGIPDLHHPHQAGRDRRDHEPDRRHHGPTGRRAAGSQRDIRVAADGGRADYLMAGAAEGRASTLSAGVTICQGSSPEQRECVTRRNDNVKLTAVEQGLPGVSGWHR